MIDTHAHLDFPQFDNDRNEVIKRFLVSGGSWLLNIGVNSQRNKKSLELADKCEEIYCSLGYHPEELEENSLKKLLLEADDFLKKQGKNKKVLAIGEIGLDYFHNAKNKQEQKKLFIKQLEIAQILGLPVILHCREAYKDVFDIISRVIKSNSLKKTKKKNKTKFVLHCYGGNLMQTESFLKLNDVYFSFTGNITFPKSDSAEIFKVIKEIPEERIMAETDCPFLAPSPHRGKRNEPGYVRLVIEKLAEIKGISFKEMEKTTDRNAERFFGV